MEGMPYLSRKQRLFQSVSNGLDDGGIGGEPFAALLGHHRPIHPHREFTAVAGLEISLLVQPLLDERRHTGSARQIISNYAVTNLDPTHAVTIARCPP